MLGGFFGTRAGRRRYRIAMRLKMIVRFYFNAHPPKRVIILRVPENWTD
jgi:hypothetical protein